MQNHVAVKIERYLLSSLYPTIYTTFTRLHPQKDPISYEKSNGCFKVNNNRTGESIYVHHYKYLYRIQSESEATFADRFKKKYTLDGFVEINKGDVVIDGGAHVGGFSLAASNHAGHVFAIEPDPRLQDALTQTLRNINNVDIHQIALGDSTGDVEFLLASNPSENSFINVDTGKKSKSTKIRGMTLDDFVSLLDYKRIDFFKLDAEGAEPEVINGFGNITPLKVAIDTSPERNGNKTTDSVRELLESRGYEIRVQNDVVFGRYSN